MSKLIDPTEKYIKNDFLSNCANKTFSVNDIILLMQRGFCSIDKLSLKIQDDVQSVLDWKLKK